MSVLRFLRSVAIVLFLTAGFGCALSEEQEIKIGRESHKQFEAEFGGKSSDPEVQGYISAIGMDMARHAGRPNLDWQFAVLKSDEINAFAVPGGYVYITQGLLYRMSNEAQVAGVLGHEAGHIAHRHSVQQIQRAQGAQAVATGAGVIGEIFGVGGVGDVAGIVASLSLMKYGRDQEKEADMSGLKYMTAAGYNPEGMVQTMEVLQAAMDGNEPAEFLSTHPNPGNRIEYLTETINEEYSAAAKSGRLGEDSFNKVVGAKKKAAGQLDLSEPVAWCGTCRLENAGR
jgi:predicted Zn-dependent protease